MISSNLEVNLRRVPPQNLEAESSILGGILLENEAINRVLEVITTDDFYRESHRRIFRAMIELYDRREPVDLITLSDFLKAKGDIETVGGTAYLAAMANAIPTTANIHYYARIVKEAAQKRKIQEAVRQTEEDIDSGDDSLAIAGRLSTAISHLQDGGPRSFIHVGDVTIKAIKMVEGAHESENPVAGIPTGLADIDTRLGGIYPGELWILAGRPSMGKTALAATIAKGAAERGYGVAFITAESPAPKIVLRMLAGVTGIENRNLRRGRVSDEEIKRVIKESQRLGDLPLWLLDSDRSWDRIKARLRAIKLREPHLALSAIDYIGLLSAPVPKGERYLELGRISSEAKGLAIELEMGILLLSQLNREVEGRTDKKPKLFDLRESGCLEQDADVVGLLYREVYYNENARYRDLAEFDIAKNRDGRTGIIKLKFHEETVSFSDWVDPHKDR